MTAWRISVIILMLCISIFRTDNVRSEPTSYLPDGHRAYDFLERMEARGLLHEAHLGSRPLTRLYVARLLESLGNDKNNLPPVDRDEYLCLIDEFAPDLKGGTAIATDDHGTVRYLPGIAGDYLYRNRRNMYATGDSVFSLFLDPVIVRSASLGDAHGGGNDNVYVNSNGFRLHGTIGNHIGLFIDVRDASESGSREYPETVVTTMPGRGFATFKGDHAEFDETHAHITYTNGPFTIAFGRGKTQWGRGASGTLGLSSYAAPIDFLSIETVYWRLKFVFLTAELEQQPPVAEYYYAATAGSTADSVTVQKRISAHRIEIDLTDRLALGLYETVIYGGRYEWSYLNPVMFLKGAEHANGDHDNAAMGMDVRYLADHGLSLYGEFFIDDISMTKLGTDWYGNKLAVQAGMFIDRPLGINGTDARIEYTRINPWVYTHRFPINSYTHYGDVLGHEIGPNADLAVIILRHRFSRRLGTSLRISKYRHGQNLPNTNVGGDPLDGFSDGDSKSASFLAGDVTRLTRYDFDISYELAWECYVELGYTYEKRNGDGISLFRAAFRLND